MRSLLRILKSGTFLTVFGFTLLISLILLLGAMLEWSWVIRLAAIVAVLFLCVVVLGITFMRANKSSDQIEKSIKQQAAQQVLSTRPDKQSEIQELQSQLEQAIEKLKQSKLGRGQRGRAALYALPWYLFIGPPGAGKTTAITNSGLNFPIGTDRVRGVGGTRNCDWFFTDSAILLDTAGRYMTEQEDTEEWLAFLETLKQYRTERPINGVLVGIALSDLAIATYDEIEWHADNIRRRVDELVKHLGVRFPVYLVFTKCDMLQGFVEFFGEMTRKEREDIWGFTLDDEQQRSKDMRSVFDQEFDRLGHALVNRRSARLSRPMKREERQKVYAFPLQLASVKENLGYFIQRLFQPNPYQESPILRGIYLTSGTQEGVPLDRVILALARQFELPTTGLHEFASQSETKSYFIKDLFTDVVVPDQYMVRRTSKASRKTTVQRLGLSVAAVVLLGLFLLGTSQALVRGKLSLNETRDVATNVGVVRWDDRAAALDNLDRVDGLRQQVERLDKTAWFGLGLYRNGTVRQPTERLYLDNARAFVRTYPLRSLEDKIRQATREMRVEGPERENLTADLKAYLLLTNERPRLEEEGNRNFLVRHLTDLAVDELEPDAPSLTRGELRARVEPQVAAYMGALRADSSRAFPADGNLVQLARNRIDEPPSIQSLYQRMKLEGRDAVPPFRLEDAVPGRFSGLLTSSTEVSGFFTMRGWDSYVNDKIEELSQNPTGEDWVMGRAGGTAPVNLGTQEQVAAELEALYFNDYGGEWERFVRSVRVKRFENLRDAARSMSDLGNANESPIAYLLAHLTVQTRFESELAGQLQDQLQQGAERAVQRRAQRLGARGRLPGAGGGNDDRHPVDRRFQWLHSLKADQLESGGASGDLYKAFAALREISNTLDGMASDEAKAAQYAGDVLKADGGDLDRELRAINGSLAAFNQDARSQLFEAPVLQAWQAILGTAQQHLNTRWREVVYEPFRSKFASFYPFDLSSRADAPLFDVEAFFAPESGTVDAFIKDELEPYVGKDLDRPRSWRGSGIRLSPAAREAVKRAKSIGANAYAGGRLQVAFELQPEQPERSTNAPSPDRVSIRLLGQEETYLMGGQRWSSYSWPGSADALLSVSTQSGEMQPKRYEGDWALFRMLQDARITPRTSSMFELRWPFERPGQYTITVMYNLRTKSAANPFGDARGFFGFQPPQSLN